MKLDIWRHEQKITLAKLGTSLGFGAVNPARSTQLSERGDRKADAHIVARILDITDGHVTAQDMHKTCTKPGLTG